MSNERKKGALPPEVMAKALSIVIRRKIEAFRVDYEKARRSRA